MRYLLSHCNRVRGRLLLGLLRFLRRVPSLPVEAPGVFSNTRKVWEDITEHVRISFRGRRQTRRQTRRGRREADRRSCWHGQLREPKLGSGRTSSRLLRPQSVSKYISKYPKHILKCSTIEN